MPRLSLRLHPSDSEPLQFKAPDMHAALAVIEINMTAGDAEIWSGATCVARLKRCGQTKATFWQVR